MRMSAHSDGTLQITHHSCVVGNCACRSDKRSISSVDGQPFQQLLFGCNTSDLYEAAEKAGRDNRRNGAAHEKGPHPEERCGPNRMCPSRWDERA